MNAMVSFGLIGGGLQAGVAAYALRLHRFFGAQRVGWFVFAAFLFLALLNLLVPVQGLGSTAVINEAVRVIIVLLIIIGMAHTEALLTSHQRNAHNTQQLRHDAERHARQSNELTHDNECLRREIAEAGGRAAALENKVKLLEPYHLLFTENPQAMWVFDPHSFQILAVNKAALGIYGFTVQQFMAQLATALCPIEYISSFGNPASQAHAEGRKSGRVSHRRGDGTRLELEITTVDLVCQNAPVRLLAVEDVTQLRRDEAHAHQAAHLEAVHRCAGIVAQQLIRPVGILHQQTTALFQLARDPEANACLTQVSQTTGCVADIVRQLVTFSRPPVLRVEPVDTNALLKTWEETLSRRAGERVSLQIVPGVNVPPMQADAEMMKQVILNLVQNAREAMPRGGVLTLRTSTVQLSKAEEPHTGRAKPGEYVCLSVQDTGCGMSPEVQARLFEPLFSTKAEDQGMGIGLATVCAIVKQHAGWVEVLTEPHRGTRFRVLIPAAARSAGAAPVTATDAQGDSTVLLVEGDDRIRALARHYLSRAGYRVIEAACGATALVLWERQQTLVDLLLTDVAIQGVSSGCALAEQLRQSKPDLKVVYTASRGAGGAAPDAAGIEPVFKPYTSQTLLQAVQSCLNQGVQSR